MDFQKEDVNMTFQYHLFQKLISRGAGGFDKGNPDLGEESAETFTIGFVYTPAAIEGLSVTLDYFDITIEDAIDNFTAQTTVD